MDPELTQKILSAEIRAARDYGKPFKWEIVSDLDALTVTATLYARDGERFIVHFECTGYRELPPVVDFIDPDTGVLGTKRAYPKSHDSLFHPQGPCICAPFNRKSTESLVSPRIDRCPGCQVSCVRRCIERIASRSADFGNAQCRSLWRFSHS